MHANLEGAYLDGANLQNSDLRYANLKATSLNEAILSGSDMTIADLREAELEWADLEDTYLDGADLRGAYLEGASLKGASLAGMEVPQGIGIYKRAATTIYPPAKFDETTRLPDSTMWTPETDMRRFTDPGHPNFYDAHKIRNSAIR